MWFKVDPRLSSPVFQQVIDGVKEAVARGVLEPGERLPSVRDLASLMALNHNTVAKAYQELEREGVIEVLRGRGAYIPGKLPDLKTPEGLHHLQESMRKLLVEAHYLSMTEGETLDMFTEVVRVWQQEKGRHGA